MAQGERLQVGIPTRKGGWAGHPAPRHLFLLTCRGAFRLNEVRNLPDKGRTTTLFPEIQSWSKKKETETQAQAGSGWKKLGRQEVRPLEP